MARVLLVAYDVQTVQGHAGGVGTFNTHFALLLRAAGEDVTILYLNPQYEPRRVDEPWREFYQRNSIGLKEVSIDAPPRGRQPDFWGPRMAEAVAGNLAGFDIVYFADWGNAGFQAVRKARFLDAVRPLFVTVLHGPSAWVLWGDRRYPTHPADVCLHYQERYAAHFSDFVVSPSRFMVDRLQTQGWELPAVTVPGLPMSGDFAEPNPAAQAQAISRIVFFGRVQKLKGFDLFVEAVRIIHGRQPEILQGREIVLLGPEGLHDTGSLDWAMKQLQATGCRIRHEGSLDSCGANAFLAESAAVTLCVVPSRGDNFPFTLIEASLIAGMNLIGSNVGGIPEMFQPPFDRQLSAPDAEELAAKMMEFLTNPLPPSKLFRYNVAEANRRWLEFHRGALAAGKRRISEGKAAGFEERTLTGRVAGDATPGSEYILLRDPAAELLPGAAERLLAAIIHSGADALVCGGYEGQRKERSHLPVAADPVSALVEPAVLGRFVVLVRRSAYEAVQRDPLTSGCRLDWLLQIQLALQGFDVDVFPEFLYWRREKDASDRNEDLRLVAAACDRASARGLQPGLASALCGVQVQLLQAKAQVADLERQLHKQNPRSLFLEQAAPATPAGLARGIYRRFVPLETRLSIQRNWIDPVVSHLQQSGLKLQQGSTTAKPATPSRPPLLPTGSQDRLRILFLTPSLPYPPVTGGRRRSWEMARTLAAGNDVTMLSFVDESRRGDLRDAAKELGGACYCVDYGDNSGAAEPLPGKVEAFWRSSMCNALKRFPPGSFDVAILDSIFMAPYRHLVGAEVVLAEHNIESVLHETEEAVPLSSYEDRVWPDFPLRVVTSRHDQAIMDNRCRVGRSVVVNNGADGSSPLLDVRQNTTTLLMTGTLSYHPNEDGALYFVREIWPFVRKEIPEAKLILAGRHPGKELMLLDGRDQIRVVVNPPDMAKVATEASVAITPLRLGSGTRIKILESFAWGLPMVSTPLGCEGLEVEDGVHLLVRQAPAAFAKACVQLLGDGAEWARLRKAGRLLLEQRYDWAQIMRGFETELRNHIRG